MCATCLFETIALSMCVCESDKEKKRRRERKREREGERERIQKRGIVGGRQKKRRGGGRIGPTDTMRSTMPETPHLFQ